MTENIESRFRESYDLESEDIEEDERKARRASYWALLLVGLVFAFLLVLPAEAEDDFTKEVHRPLIIMQRVLCDSEGQAVAFLMNFDGTNMDGALERVNTKVRKENACLKVTVSMRVGKRVGTYDVPTGIYEIWEAFILAQYVNGGWHPAKYPVQYTMVPVFGKVGYST